jgi:hypothetical protein
VGAQDLVTLECDPETVRALAARLERYGPLNGEPQWLVSAVWLCTATTDYLATSSTKVLPDGYIARPLAIDRSDDFLRQMRDEVPDIAARLMARTSDIRLPEPARPEPSGDLHRCPSAPCSTSVLVRMARCRSIVHPVACALRFDFEGGRSVLVGTDPSTPAMVLSEDRKLIDRFASACESLSAEDYLSRAR